MSLRLNAKEVACKEDDCVCEDGDEWLKHFRRISPEFCGCPRAKALNEKVVRDLGKRVVKLEKGRDNGLHNEVSN